MTNERTDPVFGKEFAQIFFSFTKSYSRYGTYYIYKLLSVFTRAYIERK